MEKYQNPIQHACDVEEGQVWIANGWAKPEGFCDGWMKNPKSAMISCNDGFRPVSLISKHWMRMRNNYQGAVSLSETAPIIYLPDKIKSRNFSIRIFSWIPERLLISAIVAVFSITGQRKVYPLAGGNDLH